MSKVFLLVALVVGDLAPCARALGTRGTLRDSGNAIISGRRHSDPVDHVSDSLKNPSYVYMLVACILIIGLSGFMIYLSLTTQAKHTWLARHKKKIHNFLVVSVWLTCGVTAGMFHEDWRFITALYVIVQIFTTIGYGDITVSSPGMQWFMTGYVLIGVMLVANIINDISNSILEAEDAKLDEKLQKMEKKEKKSETGSEADGMLDPKIEARNKFGVAVLVFCFFLVTWVAFFRYFEECSCSYGVSRIEGCQDDACAETGGSTKSLRECIYMGIVTMTTVGFGDYTPKTEHGRIFSIVWMVLGVLSCGNMVSALSGVINEQKKTKVKTQISEEAFKKIDKDGSGTLDQSEYRAFVLLDQGLVSEDVLDAIDRVFRKMDIEKNGAVSREDILEFHKEQAQAKV